MARSADQFKRDLLRRLGEEAIIKIRPKVKSETLRNALRVTQARDGRGRFSTGVEVGVPHYWAVYYHDGRGPLLPRKGRYLVYYENPKDDPRHNGNYPVKKSQVKQLTKAQWDAGLKENKRRRAKGQPPFMIVRQFVGSSVANPFLLEGLIDFVPVADRIVEEEFDLWVRETLRDQLP